MTLENQFLTPFIPSDMNDDTMKKVSDLEGQVIVDRSTTWRNQCISYLFALVFFLCVFTMAMLIVLTVLLIVFL